ncbi:MAG: TonB-dependent receptor plug domain-containing protein, partial [Cyclobacteriaceae bacterium]|nr:TonB-dependent receptor plug domain-containing protein [Cyclobacteriaceae bacterium]
MKKRILFVMALLMLWQGNMLLAQTRTVSGKVISAEDGSALPAVNVILKGTTTGSVTDVDGNYRMQIPQDGGSLVFSFIGLLTQEVAIGNQTVIDVQMRADVTELSEVIVVGYGTQIKRDLTGNIAKVSGKDIESIPLNSIETTLQGRTAGVFIQQGSGKPGQAVKMRVRGSSSVTASNQPLFVVDGVPITTQNVSITNNQPTNPLSDLNFNDVESIEVLKDASAAAIYGSRAANGVVIITTKSGKSGRTKFDIDLSTGFSRPSNKRDWLDG